MRLAIAIALAACGKSADRAPVAASSDAGPAPGPGSSAAAPRLRVISRLPAASVLVPGSRRFAIDSGGSWLAAREGKLQQDRELAAAVARLRRELGEIALHLGRDPIAIGGEEHHEQYLRLAGVAEPIPFDDVHVAQVVATEAHEVWSYQERLRSRLAEVDATNQVKPLVDLALIGKPIEGISPVSTKLCATPAIKDVAATHGSVVALVVECDPDAPVRLVTYRWPGPASAVQQLASRRALGFDPVQLAVARGVHAIAGSGAGEIHVLKVGSTPRRVAASTLTGLEVAVDAAVWLLAGEKLWRDDVEVAVRDPAGSALVPRAIARDEHLGIVVLAAARDAAWLLAEAR